MPKTETIPELKIIRKRLKRVKNHLEKNQIKQKALENITGKPKQTISMILSGYRVPLYIESFLTKIEKYYSLN